MKMLHILPVLLGLAACSESPVYTIDKMQCLDSSAGDDTKVEIYKDYAVVYSDLLAESAKSGLRMDLSAQSDNINMYEKDGSAMLVQVNPRTSHVSVTLLEQPCFFEFKSSSMGMGLRSRTKKVDEEVVSKIFQVNQ
jgi:hypothetical protein